MVAVAFGPLVAYDPTTNTLVTNGEGQVFAVTDTSFAAPLSATDLNGTALNPIRSSSIGVIDEFRVEDQTELNWKSGSYVVRLTSLKGVIALAEAAAASTSAAAAAAQAQAQAAAQAAQAAALTAAEASAEVEAYIAGGGGGGGGGAVSSVAGKTGAVVLVASDISNSSNVGRSVLQAADATAARNAITAASSEDARLTNTRTPTDGSVTTAKIASGGISQAAVTSLATDLAAKAPLAHSHAIADVTNLATSLAGKADVALAIAGILDFGDLPPVDAQVGSLWGVRQDDDENPNPPAVPMRVGAGSFANNSATLTVALPAPAAQPGDMAIYIHNHNHGALADYNFLPAGWTAEATSTGSTSSRVEVYSKVLDSADIAAGSVSITYAGPQKAAGVIEVWRNVDNVVATISQTNTSSTTKAVPAQAVTGDAVWFTAYCERNSAVTTAVTSVPSGTTAGAAPTPVGGGGATSLFTAYKTAVESDGSVGGGVWTLPLAQSIYTYTVTVGLEAA